MGASMSCSLLADERVAMSEPLDVFLRVRERRLSRLDHLMHCLVGGDVQEVDRLALRRHPTLVHPTKPSQRRLVSSTQAGFPNPADRDRARRNPPPASSFATFSREKSGSALP